MTRSARLPKGVRIAAALAAAGLIVTGCSAGQISQTADQVAAIDGANATSGQISVLNVLLATSDKNGYPAGSEAPLLFFVANAGLQTDQLIGVSSPVAGAPVALEPVTIQPQSLTSFSDDPATPVVLSGLTQDIVYGHSVPVTFTFATAGDITVKVPIAVPEDRSDEERPTVDVMPPHPTPLWHEGSEGDH